MMAEPLVSVIIPNYNYARYLPQALDSVLMQSYPAVEVIVVDDSSTDDSTAVLRGYGERIRWFQQRNQGVSVARNRGVQESRGELVAFLDADDVWLPTKLKKQVQRFLDEPDLGLVHCGFEEFDDTAAHLGVCLEGLEGWVATELLLFRRPAILMAGSTAIVPLSTFESVGGFDPRFSTSADWDFCYRIARRQRVGFVREALVRYRSHHTNMHANIGLMEQDMLLGYQKAFSCDTPELRGLRRQCYGNLHMVLSGSFFRAGRYYDCLRHLLKSLWLTPGNYTRIVEFPLRTWRRFRARSVSPSSTHGVPGKSADSEWMK